MRAYINGRLSESQSCFLPDTLWFSSDDADDNTCVSFECCCLIGHTIEGAAGASFSTRWKGVSFSHLTEEGDLIETEEFSISEFLSYINERKFRLTNMDAYLDKDTSVYVEELILVDSAERYVNGKPHTWS